MTFTKELIAPCGINCAVCLAYLREKNTCAGCLGPDEEKRPSCRVCKKKTCEEHAKAEFTYCFECPKFPCRNLKDLEKRYTTKYNYSPITTLNQIKEKGFEAFLASEEEKWKCKNCGATLCVHRDKCLQCGEKYR